MKVLLIAGHAGSVINFRAPLLRAMVACGHEVHVAAPGLLRDDTAVLALERIGVVGHDISLDRTGINPLADIAGFWSIVQMLRGLQPDLVLSYTIKPVIYGTLAAWFTRVPRRFALITGLGYAFTGKARGKRRLVQIAARGLYRLALARSHGAFFQNPDDAALFTKLRLVTANKVHIVNGSGVDMAHYARAPLPDKPLSFLLIARLLGDKGVREYVKAAREIRRLHTEVVFHLVGGLDSNPDAIPESEVRDWHSANDIIWHGALPDVRPMIAGTHVYVLPSYREGTPRSVLEAMAMGRAIVTTDAPGCRETVRSGENGFLVHVADVDALTDAMHEFLRRPELITSMGAKSYEIAAERYDVHKVNAVMLAAMNLQGPEG